MVLAINYADEKFRTAQKFNSKTAVKTGGVDRVEECGTASLDEAFRQKNHEILNVARGAGLWLWKPYIIRKALMQAGDGDYIVYTDAGCAFVNNVSYLIESMNAEQTDVMVFCIEHLERKYTKRDAFILMDCDSPEYSDTPQICGGYIVLRKTEFSCGFVDEWLNFAQDKRIITDDENVMGKTNYEGFVENRHDQSILSLLCKKKGIRPFRDPSEYGLKQKLFSPEVCGRSKYPQIFESHRNPNCRSIWQLGYYNKLYKGMTALRIYIGKKKRALLEGR